MRGGNRAYATYMQKIQDGLCKGGALFRIGTGTQLVKKTEGVFGV